jgi:hypothetical protein
MKESEEKAMKTMNPMMILLAMAAVAVLSPLPVQAGVVTWSELPAGEADLPDGTYAGLPAGVTITAYGGMGYADTGELPDHTTGDGPYVYPYWGNGIGDSAGLEFNQLVEIPSLWIYIDDWVTPQPAYIYGWTDENPDPTWVSGPLDFTGDWVEVTAGAGYQIDWLGFYGSYMRVDDMTVVIGGKGASAPQPEDGATVSVDLSELRWTNPDPNIVGTTITCDVYFGTGDPNHSLPGFGFTRITPVGGITETHIDIPIALTPYQTYYWVVDCHDASMAEGKELLAGGLWSFNTNNTAPVVNAGEDQYVWLGNAGDPSTATVQIDATVTDDGLPAGKLTLHWEQIDTGPAVIIDPANVADITLVFSKTGTYEFQLTANDTDLTGSDTLRIVVAETPCVAAQAMPGYQAIIGDFDKNCTVGLPDLAELASHWLECNSLQCP